MDTRWTQTPRDSSRTVAIIRHHTATFVDILNGTSTDGQDLTQYVTSAKHSSSDADISFTYNTELSGTNQPVPGDLLEIVLNGLTLWVGVIDSIQDYALSSGTRRLTVKAYSRQNMTAWKSVKRVTPIYAVGTPVNSICNDIAEAVGLSPAEIALPIVPTYTVHSNMQLAQMSAWEMLSGALISSGYSPWVNARGQLTAISRDLARPAAISLSEDRIVSIGGSKSKSPVSSVRIKWLDPALTEVVHQDQALETATITAGFFQRHQHREIYFSTDRTQQAKGTYMIVKQSANSGLLPVCSENYTQYSPVMGAIDLVTASWAPRLAIDGIAGIIAASFIPDNVASFGGGVTIPVGRLVEAASQVGVMLIMMSIGTGIYEIRGQPYDSVHARNTTEAKALNVPDWLLEITDIENDFTMSETHAQAFAGRELIYQIRSATNYKATILDDPRIEVGDILELYDGSRLYVLDYSRDISSGSAAILDVTGFRADISTKSSIVSTPTTAEPSAPATLTATVVSSTEIDLTWTASTETGGSIASYVVYRDGVSVGTVPGGVLTWKDTGLTASTAYAYQVLAIDVLGNQGTLTTSVSAETKTTGGTGGGSGSGFTPTSFDPPFPRTAFIGIGSTSTLHQYNNVGGLLADYSRYNIFVWPSGAEGWYINAGGGDRQTMITLAKSLTTAPLGTKHLIYGENDSYYTSSDPYPTFTTEVKARNWELTTASPYNSSGPLYVTPDGNVQIDYAAASSSTAYAGTNPSGETPYQYAAHYQFYLKLNKTRTGADASRFSAISPNDAAPAFDGVSFDNVLVDPRNAADWKRNGTLSTHDGGAYQGTWSDGLAQGQRQYFDEMAALISAAGGQQWLCANAGDYARADLGNNETTAGVMWGVLDCMNLEGCIGKSWSIETQKSYADLQADIAQAIAFTKGPKAVMLNFCLPNGGSALSGGLPWSSVPTAVNGQHQWERYFVATALMNNGYCSIQFQTSGYNAELSDLTWPVEYDANGVQKGYLGNPVDAAQTGIRTWYDGSTVTNAWAREFDNGLAIAIAKTGTGAAVQPTGTVTISSAQLGIPLGKKWKTIDGTSVTSVTLQKSRDGAVLLKDTSSGTGGGTGALTVGGSDKSAAAGTIRPVGGQIFVASTTGALQIPFERFLGESGSRSITVTTFDSTNAVAGTNYTSATSTLTWTDGEIGRKEVSINITSIPTGFGIVGISVSGDCDRPTSYIWLKGTGLVPGAHFMISSNGVNVGGNTSGAGTSVSPWQSLEHAVAQMSTLGTSPLVLYVIDNGTHTEWSGSAGSSDGPHMVGSYSTSNPLIILPHPSNTNVVKFDQGSTAGGANVLYSNANGPTFPTGSSGSGIWICGFRFTRGNVYFYYDAALWTDCVIWQCETDNYSASGSNVHCVRGDHTKRLIIQDCYAHHSYTTEQGTANSYDSVASGFESCIGGFYMADATIAHCHGDHGQYLVMYKQASNTITDTPPYVTHCYAEKCQSNPGSPGLLMGYPVQGAGYKNGVIAYCAYDGTNDVTAGGGLIYAPGSEGQSSHIDIVSCVSIASSHGGGGIGQFCNTTNVRVFDTISQGSSTLNCEIKLGVPGSGLSTQLEISNHNIFAESCQTFVEHYGSGSIGHSPLTAWQTAAPDAYLSNLMDVNSIATSTTPAYPNVSLHDYRINNSGGRAGRSIGVGSERLGVVNNFLNPDLVKAPT